MATSPIWRYFDITMHYNLFYNNGARGYFTSLQLTPLTVPFREGATLILPKQTHTANVAVVVTGREDLSDVDAVITSRSDFSIGVRTADCVPILMHAPDIQAVAAIHAGWRGSLNGIVDRTVERLIQMGATPEKIVAAFGPSICCNCYEVDLELVERFASAGFEDCVATEFTKPHLNLQAVNRQRMLSLGLKADNIQPSDFCTLHSLTADAEPVFPSWRRRPGIADRLITFISL